MAIAKYNNEGFSLFLGMSIAFLFRRQLQLHKRFALLLAPMIYEYVQYRKVHPVYKWGAAAQKIGGDSPHLRADVAV